METQRILLLASLCLGPYVSGCAHTADSATLCRVESAVVSGTLAAGERGIVRLDIHPAPGYHLSDKAPIQLTLSSTSLTLEKTELGSEEALVTARGKRFEIPITTQKSGPASLGASADLFLCNRDRCVREHHQVTVPVDVR